MSLFGRSRRLRCFYCGQTSAQKRTLALRQFDCEHCEATNHLDENGQITDPPPDPQANSAPTLRYARTPAGALNSQTQTTATSSFTSAEDVWCSTCRNNQFFLTETLASLEIPTEGSPEYDAHLDYVRRLKGRYPTVCPDCAPAARERVRQAEYMAQVDNMGRLNERTRREFVSTHGHSGRSLLPLLLRVTEFCVYFSTLVQILWHLLAAKTRTKYAFQPRKSLWPPRESMLALSECYGGLQQLSVSPACTEAVAYWMPLGLSLAVMTCWWNPKLRDKYVGSGGRLVGMRDYYSFQAATILIRFAAARVFTAYAHLFKGAEITIAGAHLTVAISIFMMTLLSRIQIRIDHTPRFSFSSKADEILPDVSSLDEDVVHSPSIKNLQRAQPQLQQSLASLRNTRTTTPLSISSLATPQPQRYPTPARELSPALSEVDHMDWTPTTPQSVDPSAKYNLRSRPAPPPAAGLARTSALAGSSPFVGKLPSAPLGRMRHPRAHEPPPPNPFQQKPGWGAGQNPFTAGSFYRPECPRDVDASTEATETDAATEIADSEYGDGIGDTRPKAHLTADKTRRRSSRDLLMAPTRLWLEKDRVDTGLERVFDEVMGLKTPGKRPRNTTDDRMNNDTSDGNKVDEQSTIGVAGVAGVAGAIGAMVAGAAVASQWF